MSGGPADEARVYPTFASIGGALLKTQQASRIPSCCCAGQACPCPLQFRNTFLGDLHTSCVWPGGWAGQTVHLAAPHQPVHVVRPLINCRGSYTAMSGSRTLPEVKAAMEAAGLSYVDIGELQEAVGVRLGQLMGCELGMVTNGCAAALAHMCAGCLAGTDRKKQAVLPFTEGMIPNEVIVQKCHRFGCECKAFCAVVLCLCSAQNFIPGARRTSGGSSPFVPVPHRKCLPVRYVSYIQCVSYMKGCCFSALVFAADDYAFKAMGAKLVEVGEQAYLPFRSAHCICMAYLTGKRSW
jgi:hypothetical protein